MKRIGIASAMALCVVLRAGVASADSLILRDATRISARVVSVAARTIRFEDASGVQRGYNADQVDGLEFRPTSQPNTAVGTTLSSRRFEALLSGTELTVRTSEDIDSSTAVVNQTFSGIVERDIRGESDTVIIPAGACAVLVRLRGVVRWETASLTSC
jgi:hypothetical protein